MEKPIRKLVLVLVVFVLLGAVALVVILFGALVCVHRQANDLPGQRSEPHILHHDGIERRYNLYVPNSLDPTAPSPLLLALHGGGGHAKSIEVLSRNRVNVLAERAGMIVAYPEGIGKHWNDGRLLDYEAHRRDIDDFGFLVSLIEYLFEEHNVDRDRVYLLGVSNGALMSFRLACERADLITAMAPVIGGLAERVAAKCQPSRPVPLLMINGDADPLVPWDETEVRFGRKSLGRRLSVPGTRDFWARVNGCTGPSTIEHLPDREPDDGTSIRIETMNSCDAGKEVTLIAVEGGGHTWPGGSQYAPGAVIGRTSREMDTTEVIFKFFGRHPSGR